MTDDDDPGVRRRDLLRTLGVSGVATALAGCAVLGSRRRTPTGTPPRNRADRATPTAGREATETPEEPPEDTPEDTPEPADIPHAEEYGTVVDLGRAGADPTGGEDIIPLLAEHAGDDTLLYLPPGTYLMTDDWLFSEFSHFGIVGPEATIRPPDGYRRTLFLFTRAEGLLFEGVTFDFSAESTGARPLNARIDDDLVVRDVTVVGEQDADQDMMRFDVTHPDGSGLVERMRLPDGATRGMPITGCLVTGDSEGTLTFRDCEIAGFPDNGLYASSAEGPVEVIGGHYTDNDIANVRVGDDATVRGVTIRINGDTVRRENARGIWLREGSSALVEDCTVEVVGDVVSDGAIMVSTHMREAAIRNTRILTDADRVAAVRASSPVEMFEANDVSTALHLENVEIAGSARFSSAVSVVDRDDSRFEGLCIEQTGDSRDGIRLLRSDDARISDAGIDVTGEQIVLEQSTAETEAVRRSCASTDGTTTPEGDDDDDNGWGDTTVDTS